VSAVTTRLEQALDLAAKGYYVFPAAAKDQPLVREWQNAATTDPEAIATWWGQWPNAFVCITPGRSGHTVIDIDVHPEQPSGFDSALMTGAPVDADVSNVSMGGEGKHLWYLGTNRNGRRVNGMEGVDSRSVGGYVVAHDGYVLPDASEITEPLPAKYTVPVAPASTTYTRGEFAAFLKSDETPLKADGHELLARLVASPAISHDQLLLDQVAIRGLRSGWAEAVRAYQAHYCRDPWDTALWRKAFTDGLGGLSAPHPAQSITASEARAAFGLIEPTVTVAGAVPDRRAVALAKFPSLDVKSILDPRRPPRRWIWDGIAGRDDHTSIIAQGGTGKSLLVLGLTIARQRGLPDFIGRPIATPARTLYLDLENSDDDWAERLTDLGVTEAEMTDWYDSGSLTVVPFPRFGGLDTAGGAALLFELVDALELAEGDLVVFDSTQRITVGKENDNDTGRALYAHTIEELKRRKIASIRTDNTGKNVSLGARGGSSKRDDVGNSWDLSVKDGVYELERDKKRSKGVSDVLAWKLDDSSGRLEFKPTATVTYVDKLRAAGKALDAAKVPHTMAVNPAWDAVKAAPGGVHPMLNRDLVRTVQRDRKAAAEAYK
jgi:hypothetical protein